LAADWVRLCRSRDLAVDEPHVNVKLEDGRQHRIAVEDQLDLYQLTAIVVRQAVVASLPDVPVQAWLRNRATVLVGFRIDRQRRLLAEASVPKAGLTAEEFQLYLRKLAAESDRFEYVLTGRDAE
jgi:hypothetical protein